MSVLEENWSYHVDLSKVEKCKFHEFELHISELCNDILKVLEISFLQTLNPRVSSAQSYDEELKLLQDKNRQLRQEMDTKLKELSQQQTQYESYKQDQKLLSQEVKETHEAFLMAKKYYKKFLKMYCSIESRTDDKQVIFIQFFTEAKKDSENYSAKFLRDRKSKQYELISTTPTLKMFKEFHQILLQTNDLLGALYSIREEFIVLKRSKK